MKHKIILIFAILINSVFSINLLANDLSKLVKITKWKVSWEGRPRDPFVAPTGEIWFCGQAGNYIARFEPSTEKFKKFEVPEGSHPHNLIIDSKGFVWYAGNRNAHIGKLDPKSGKITKFDMPEAIKDPHTLVFDQNENIWFTAQSSNAIGHLTTKTGKVNYVTAKTDYARPYGIKMDHNNKPWIVLVGTNKLATVDLVSFKLLEIDLPRQDARSRRLEITEDNNIWYVDYAGGYLGQYNPKTKKFNEWKMPGGERSFPYGTALDTDQKIWVAETGSSPNNLVGFDTKTQKFLGSTKVKSDGSIRHMYFDPASNSFWFGIDSGFIGQAKILKLVKK